MAPVRLYFSAAALKAVMVVAQGPPPPLYYSGFPEKLLGIMNEISVISNQTCQHTTTTQSIEGTTLDVSLYGLSSA